MSELTQTTSAQNKTEPVVVNVNFGDQMPRSSRGESTSSSRIVGWLGALVALVAVGSLAHSYAGAQPEGSRAREIKELVDEYALDLISRYTDPEVTDNPACVLIEPAQVENSQIDPSDMPRPCGEILTSSGGEIIHPDDTIHLGIRVENAIDITRLSRLYEENPNAPQEYFESLLELNSPEGMVEHLEAAGLCTQALSEILGGIEDTRAEEDPFDLGQDRDASVKLFGFSEEMQDWVEIESECS